MPDLRCAKCKAERGLPRARAENRYMHVIDGAVFALEDGSPMGFERGSEFPEICLETVSLTRTEPHLCQACRPKSKAQRRRYRRRSAPGQLSLPGEPR